MFENNSSLKLLQTWERGTPVNITFVVSGNVKYDEMGRAVEQGMSFTGSGNGSYETGSSKKTETEYDSRGRAVRVTAPDGTETEINYGINFN